MTVSALQAMSALDFSNYELTNRNKHIQIWREQLRFRSELRKKHRRWNLSKQLANKFDVVKPQEWTLD